MKYIFLGIIIITGIIIEIKLFSSMLSHIKSRGIGSLFMNKEL